MLVLLLLFPPNEPRRTEHEQERAHEKGEVRHRQVFGIWGWGQQERPAAFRQPAFQVKISGNDLLSRLVEQYHRRAGLNGRVRDGNGCGPCAMVTGKLGDKLGSGATD